MILEKTHFVPILYLIDINGNKTSAAWHVKGYERSVIDIIQGVAAAADTITVEKCKDAAGTGNVAIGYSYRVGTTTATDVMGDLTSCAYTGQADMSTTNNVFCRIEIPHNSLGEDYEWLRVVFTCGGSNLTSAGVTLHNPAAAKRDDVTAIS